MPRPAPPQFLAYRPDKLEGLHSEEKKGKAAGLAYSPGPMVWSEDFEAWGRAAEEGYKRGRYSSHEGFEGLGEIIHNGAAASVLAVGIKTEKARALARNIFATREAVELFPGLPEVPWPPGALYPETLESPAAPSIWDVARGRSGALRSSHKPIPWRGPRRGARVLLVGPYPRSSGLPGVGNGWVSRVDPLCHLAGLRPHQIAWASYSWGSRDKLHLLRLRDILQADLSGPVVALSGPAASVLRRTKVEFIDGTGLVRKPLHEARSFFEGVERALPPAFSHDAKG